MRYGDIFFSSPKKEQEIPFDSSIAIMLIELYQSGINVNSISRCPFYVSCSNFAIGAIKGYGFAVGMLFFIDRIYFREHPEAYLYYPKK